MASTPDLDRDQTEFDVVLVDAGHSPINLIKELRAFTSLGVKEARQFIETLPQTVKYQVSRDEADNVQQRLHAAGARAEIQ